MYARAAASLKAAPARTALLSAAATGATVLAIQKQHNSSLSLPSLSLSPSISQASGDCLEAPKLKWQHTGFLSGFDHAALRRGWQVYKEVCAACHGINQLKWRNLVNVVMTEEEAKELAAESDYPDEPDADGEVGERPGKLADPLPEPYANEQAARAGNNGALPPDLSLVAKSREAGPDYLFALLTGYRDPPAGVQLREGLYYNLYFPGGAIAMTQALSDNMIEYDDGTEASTSQMAKDIAVFLNWAAEPEMDERKKMGLKACMMLMLLAGPTLFWRRQKWSPLKTRVISFTQVKPSRVTTYVPPRK